MSGSTVVHCTVLLLDINQRRHQCGDTVRSTSRTPVLYCTVCALQVMDKFQNARYSSASSSI
jgi:hypothetical protein